MKSLIAITVAICVAILTGASSAICADVSGMVTDSQGHPVPGVKIAVQDLGGKIIDQVVTDAKGHYAISGLSPDTYDYILEPLATGFKGGDAVAHLDSKGLIINWKVSERIDAAALATRNGPQEIAGDPFGLSMGEFMSAVALGTGVVAAGVVGGYGAAGGFSGPSNHPTSPSM